MNDDALIGRLTGRFLVLPGPHEGAVRETLTAIERAHGPGWEWSGLPCVTVNYDPGEGMWGRYAAPHSEYGLVGRWHGPAIQIAPACPVARFTFAHEFAHLLDHACAGFSPLALLRLPSERAGSIFGPVLRAARDSAAVRGRDALLGDSLMPGGKEKAVAYRLRRAEVWSEAYAQWVALRSGDAGMAAEVAHQRAHLPDEVWPDEDFAPIAAELDRVMAFGSAALMPPRGGWRPSGRLRG